VTPPNSDVRCRCPHGTPLHIEAHGLAPAGWKKPEGPSEGPRLPDCVLCGNLGRTTSARLRMARLGALLAGAGWLAVAAAVALSIVTFVTAGTLAPAAMFGALGAVCLVASAALERGLARSVPVV